MKFTQITGSSDEHQTVTTDEKTVFFLYNYSGEVHIDIQEEKAEVHIVGIYIGHENDAFNVKTVQKHSKGNNVSDLLIKGVFFDDSRFEYEGLIRIEAGAHGSNAYQKNQNLVMSPGVFVDSRPFLEIKADDVRCTHGSTTGRLDKDQLLYAQSRGIASNDAKDMLVEGFVRDVIQHLRDLGVDKTIDISV